MYCNEVETGMKNETIVCIDFDGVLCDSVLECFVSSWIGYYSKVKKEHEDVVTLEHFNLYRRYRPFIRNGEDYIVLQQCIEEGRRLETQRDFDDFLTGLGADTAAYYRNVFYEVREQLLETEREYWLRLNRIFRFHFPIIHDIAKNSCFHIVSTKPVRYIVEILEEHNVVWPRPRIHCVVDISKVSYIEELMHNTGADQCAFIEDQLDHLGGAADRNISPYLAEWGYIKKEWLTMTGINSLSSDEFVSLMRSYLVDTETPL
jgi:phosphoglycolate phosphatase-like HAD superfamily hydrolase